LDSETDSTPETESKVGGETAPQELAERSQPAARVRNHPRRVLIVLTVGIGSICLLQSFATGTDHQNTNMASIGVGFITAICLAFQLHFWGCQRGHRFLAPIAVAVMIGALAVLFRVDGFSGEMLPQIKYRFAKKPPEMRFLTSTSKLANESEAAVEATSVELSADQDSLGFLGSNRTGVIRERHFDVPTDASQVETCWNQGIGEGWSSFAVAGDRAVTLEQRGESECVTCYRLSDGELLWIESHQAYHSHPLGGAGPRSTPTIVGDNVYAQGSTGRVWCLSLQTGKVNWTVDLLERAGWDQRVSEKAISWGRSTSPLVVDGLCVVPFGGPAANAQTGRSLVAFDAATGDVRWTTGEDQISYASPGLLTLAGQRQIVSVNEKTITGHTVKDGRVLWSFDWLGQSNAGANCAMVIPAGNDRFLIGKGYGGGSALVLVRREGESWSAEAEWTSTRLLKTKFTHACVDGDIAFAISNGSLEAVSVTAAEQRWRQPRRTRLGQGQIMLVEDTIVAQSESGEVALIAADPDEYRELLRLPAMDSKTWNVPTIAGRYLLVRNDRQAICFRLPERVDKAP
jgi:outer membrane protein assembly factor BamB